MSYDDTVKTVAEVDQVQAEIKAIYDDPEQRMGLVRSMLKLNGNQRLTGNDYRRLTHALGYFLNSIGATELENQMEQESEEKHDSDE